jgi:hypothetical protein
MKMANYIQQNRLAFWISLIYVVAGGVVASSLYPDDPLNGNWWFWGWLITLPTNVISSTYRFMGGTEYYPVLIIQFLIFIPTFIGVSRLIAKRNKK